VATAKALIKELSRLSEKLDAGTQSLLERPNRNNVHNIRTLIRRVEAACTLLPKNLQRKGRVENYLKCMKTLFKATTPIRDLDITESGLRKFESKSRGGLQQVLEQISKARATFEKAVSRPAGVLSEQEFPKIKRNQISDSKFSKNRKKVIQKLESKLEALFPVMIAHPSNLESLHSLRKNCKTLRYALGIGRRTKREQRKIKLLKRWQDLLGEITDLDVMLRYIASHKFEEPFLEIENSLKGARKEKFRTFARMRSGGF